MKEFRRLDRNSEEMGVPVSKLMQTAGRRLADAAARMAPTGTIVFLCGKGNNGGDGYAAAAQLTGRDVVCVQVEPPSGRESAAFARSVESIGWRQFREDPPPRRLVVDCLLGSGLRDRPRAPYDEAIAWMNRQRAPVLACDVPSGLGTTLAVRPKATLTFHARKEGMVKATCGDITVVSIGIPAKAASHVGIGDLAVGYPTPRAASHKGDHGRLLVVGGGPFTGAPYYAAMAAYRTGADLVELWAPEEAAQVIMAWGPDVLVHAACDGDRFTMDGVEALGPALDRADAVVIGPGMGSDLQTVEAVRELLDEIASRGLPVVIDADGLDGITKDWLARHGAKAVLTPHGQEFADLGGKPGSGRSVQAYARRHGTTVVVTGAVDHISDGHRRKECHRGHPTMTVGGTGDVLAGTLGCLLAKGATPFDAACAATYLVGCAGEIAAASWGPGALARDVSDAVAAVLSRL